LARVDVDLRVPGGLRTLSPTHPSYVGRYGGDQNVERPARTTKAR
jgi:glycogen debranching enzyme